MERCGRKNKTTKFNVVQSYFQIVCPHIILKKKKEKKQAEQQEEKMDTQEDGENIIEGEKGKEEMEIGDDHQEMQGRERQQYTTFFLLK